MTDTGDHAAAEQEVKRLRVLMGQVDLLLVSSVVHCPNYSRGKWRVRTPDGTDLWTVQDYPESAQPTGYTISPVPMPLCADTKKEAERLLTAARWAAHTTLALTVPADG